MADESTTRTPTVGTLPMHFRITPEERLRAVVQGVPAYIRRRRRIEDMIAFLVDDLRAFRAAGATEAQVRARADEIDLRPLHALIESHNRFYPIEANLPVDLETGRLLERASREPWQPMPLVTRDDLLATL